MVHHPLAGQPVGQPGGGGADPRRPRPQIGALAPQPEDLWPHRLRGQRIAAAAQDHVSPHLRVQQLDLLLRAGIHAVKHAVHQGLMVRIHRQHAGADGAGGDARDSGGVDALRQQGTGHGDEITPPVAHGIMFGPAGARHRHLVLVARLGQNAARRVGDDALGLKGADIDAQKQCHRLAPRSRPVRQCHAGCPPSRVRRIPGPIRASAASVSRASAARSPRSQHSSAEWLCRIGNPISRLATPAPSVWT